MDKKKYEYRDSSGVEHIVELEEKNFQLAQSDKKIHDQKFKTKPTTFFKDALKRFGKNKSSVCGAAILGVLLLLSVIVPIIDTSDLNTPKPHETLLEPKLFESGTGFWDGTKQMTNIACDPETKFEGSDGVTYYYPDLNTYSQNAISKLSKPSVGYIYSATRLGIGGFAQLINSNDDLTGSNYEDLVKGAKELTSKTYNFDLDKHYAIEIKTMDEKLEGYAIADYEVFLTYNLETTSDEDPEKTTTTEKSIKIKGYEDETTKGEVENPVEKDKPFQVDVYKNDDILKELRDSEERKTGTIKDIALKILVLPVAGSQTSLLLNSVSLTSTEDKTLAKEDTISFTDANEFLIRDPKEAKNYWKYNDIRQLYKGSAFVCNFVYDTYEATYGEKTQDVADSEIKVYVDKGWLKEDILSSQNLQALWNKGKKADELFQTFVLNKEKLPIISLIEVTRASHGSTYGYTFKSIVSGYKLLGYDKMPKFLAGTDKDGYNLVKQVFVGLRNSLGLGLLTFAICFSFGLVFGAICGYFGGSIDMVLQRLVDILSGVPWIVIMTLCILHFGSNFWTFILAMCLTGWIGTSSLTRTQFYRFRDREYTLASRTLGASNPRLIFRHILPNAMGTIITSSVLMIPSVIFSEATISYLGLGFQDMTSLGVILSENQTYLLTYPHLILFPSVIMALIMISFNLFGNGLRDAFNPSLKGSE